MALMQTPAESSAGTGGGKTPGVRHVDPGDCMALPHLFMTSASRYNFRVFLGRAFDWTVVWIELALSSEHHNDALG